MKKLLLIIACICCAFSSMAQLKMGSSGAIGIGNNILQSDLIYPNSIFTIYTNDYYHGCTVKMGSGGGDGIRVEYDKTSSTLPFTAYRNNTRVFYVDEIGGVYATGSYQTSDRSLKKNIETITTPLDKVMQLQGISFDMNFPEPDDLRPKDLNNLFESAQKRTPGLTREIFDQIQKEKSRKRLGVIAQDVEKVLPELVRTRDDGLKAVAYPEMVAVLIEAIKEQQAQIEELHSAIEKLEASFAFDAPIRSATNATGMSGIVDPLIAQCKLYQNAPNPFKERTEIRYYLPQDVQSAEIYIFNLQGSLLKKVPATNSGLVEIKGSDLHAGMFIYTLVVNGQTVDAKRMILTK